MAVQNTIDLADAVVLILNAALPLGGETITFARTFIPEFDPDDLANLAEPGKGSVFPSQLDLTRASRHDDAEGHVIEIGLGRKIDNESASVEQQMLTVEAVKNVLRLEANQVLTLPVDGDEVQFLGIEIVLLVPELLRKRVALSVVRVTYRGFV